MDTENRLFRTLYKPLSHRIGLQCYKVSRAVNCSALERSQGAVNRQRLLSRYRVPESSGPWQDLTVH